MNKANEFAMQYTETAQAIGIKPEAYDVHFRRLTAANLGEMSFFIFSNVYKEGRPRAPTKQQTIRQQPACGLCKDVDRAKTKGDNIMFKDDYTPFVVIPNLFPLDFGHAMLVDKQHLDEYYCAPDRTKLETIVRFTDETGLRCFRNVHGTNSSMPNHEHVHIMPVQFPVEYVETREIAEGIEELVSFPGQHSVFSGENRAIGAYDFISRLQKEKHPSEDMQKLGMFPYVILFASSKIYVAPIRVPQYPKPGSIGAGEIFGVYATPIKKKLLDKGVTEEKWNSISAEERANTILQIQASIMHRELWNTIVEVLFPHDSSELNVKKLVKA
ncbi:MAG TPA: hypothetical protein DDW41_02765 [Candidatus Andersenbacteria bacterium]|nr:hypothetical protein [Candidatus Andersenbacteria bacterium]